MTKLPTNPDEGLYNKKVGFMSSARYYFHFSPD